MWIVSSLKYRIASASVSSSGQGLKPPLPSGRTAGVAKTLLLSIVFIPLCVLSVLMILYLSYTHKPFSIFFLKWEFLGTLGTPNLGKPILGSLYRRVGFA